MLLEKGQPELAVVWHIPLGTLECTTGSPSFRFTFPCLIECARGQYPRSGRRGGKTLVSSKRQAAGDQTGRIPGLFKAGGR